MHAQLKNLAEVAIYELSLIMKLEMHFCNKPM